MLIAASLCYQSTGEPISSAIARIRRDIITVIQTSHLTHRALTKRCNWFSALLLWYWEPTPADSHFYAWLFAILLQLLWVTVIPVTLLTITTCTTCLWWLWARTERNSWRAREAAHRESGHWSHRRDSGHSGDCEECGVWRYWRYWGRSSGCSAETRGPGAGRGGGGSLGQGSQSTGAGVTFQKLRNGNEDVCKVQIGLQSWDLNAVIYNVIMLKCLCFAWGAMSRHYLICWLRWHNPMSCHETL